MSFRAFRPLSPKFIICLPEDFRDAFCVAGSAFGRLWLGVLQHRARNFGGPPAGGGVENVYVVYITRAGKVYRSSFHANKLILIDLNIFIQMSFTKLD